MNFPLTMSGWDRTYQPPRSIRSHVPVNTTAWDLLHYELDPAAQQWAAATLDSLMASIDAQAAEALGCTDCEDVGFYGVTDPSDPDMLTGLLRRQGDGSFQALQGSGHWDDWDPKGVPVEILTLDLAGDLAAAITGGACGLVRRFCVPKAFLPPCAVVSAAPLSDALMSLVSPQPPTNTESSDNDWINYAVVDELDPGAVLDLVRIRAAGTAVDLERWDESSSWTPDPVLLAENGLPTVRLTDDQLAGIQEQLNPSTILSASPDPLVADAPLTVSPNPKAEKLRRYWSTGRGGAKIRWTAPGNGDFNRCYRHLRKYMGIRAKGYCANLHRRNTGVWPGDRKNTGRLRGSAVDSPVRLASGVILSLGDRFQVEGLKTGPYSAQVVDCPTLGDWADPKLMGDAVNVLLASGGVPDHAVAIVLDRTGVDPMPPEPTRPVGANSPEIQQSLLNVSAVSTQNATLRVGMILTPTREEVLRAKATLPDVMVAAIGAALWDNSGWAHGTAPERVAIVLPTAVVSLTPPSGHDWTAGALIDHTATHGFHNTRISPEASLLASVRSGQWGRETERNTDMPLEMELLQDGVYYEGEDENAGILRTLTAGGFPVAPPDSWYADPKLAGPTPMEITDDGQVYGHIATWDVTHIGMPKATHAPRSPSGYKYFLTGQLKTESGKAVNVGQLTLAGGHADINGNVQAAVQHYDDTNSAVADVTCGEDAYGIWVAGGLRPSVTDEQVRIFRASPPSGDWRPVNGHLEMVACCSVNVPGFMNVRPTARVASGAVVALVAAGTAELHRLRVEALTSAAVIARLETLESTVKQLGTPVAAELINTEPVVAAPESPAVEPVIDTTSAAPVEAEPPVVPEASPETPVAEAPAEPEQPTISPEEAARAEHIARVRDEIKQAKREALRKRVAGVPAVEPTTAAASTIKGTDSFPISDVASLKKAIQAFGRAGDKEAAKKHIISMAYKLKRPDLIPSNWRSSK